MVGAYRDLQSVRPFDFPPAALSGPRSGQPGPTSFCVLRHANTIAYDQSFVPSCTATIHGPRAALPRAPYVTLPESGLVVQMHPIRGFSVPPASVLRVVLRLRIGVGRLALRAHAQISQESQQRAPCVRFRREIRSSSGVSHMPAKGTVTTLRFVMCRPYSPKVNPGVGHALFRR
jgi:hypothetical protein